LHATQDRRQVFDVTQARCSVAADPGHLWRRQLSTGECPPAQDRHCSRSTAAPPRQPT